MDLSGVLTFDLGSGFAPSLGVSLCHFWSTILGISFHKESGGKCYMLAIQVEVTFCVETPCVIKAIPYIHLCYKAPPCVFTNK